MANYIPKSQMITSSIDASLDQISLADSLSIKHIDHPSFDKYQYVIQNVWIIKGLYIIGFICWCLVLWGYGNLFYNNFWFGVVLGPIVAFQTAYLFLSYGINLFYDKPDLLEHIKLVNQFTIIQDQYKPSVDILLPVCGEDFDIIQNTWKHVTQLKYVNYKVYVLDDTGATGSPQLKQLAQELGFNYLARPNRGEMKKAGNLKYGFERSNNEYVVILDADFAPHPDFLNETVPYLFIDDKVGILQTPQYFENSLKVNSRNWLEYGAGCIQEDFYRIIQTSRNALGGSICVGSNAVYRRAALEKVGGTAQVEHSEDVMTGVNVIAQGYDIVYKPYILAMGYCPDVANAFFKQQYRWCKGSLMLMTSKFFWDIDIPFYTKLCYMSGFAYYINCLFNYILPFSTLVVLWFNFGQIKLEHSILYIPILIFNYIFMQFSRTYIPTFGVYIAKTLALSSYCLAVMHTILRLNMNWVPTGAVKNQAKDFWFNFLYYSNIVYLLVYVGALIFFYLNNRFPLDDVDYYSIYFWIFLTIFNVSCVVLYLTKSKLVKN
jgi:cellulose synthase (UDP-forming)